MTLPRDTPFPADRQLLMDLAHRLEPHIAEITADWVAAVERVLIPDAVDRDAYRQMLGYFVGTSMRAYVQFVGAGDLEGMYEFQYVTNREGAAASLGDGAMPLYDPKDVHLTMRAAAPVVTRWIERLYAGDVELELRVKLAQERLGARLGLILSEAYGDAREARLQAIRDERTRALEVSERLHGVGQVMVRSLDTEPLLDFVLRTAAQLLRADGAAIWLANREGTELRVHRVFGGEQNDRGRPAAIGESASGWAFQTNASVRSVRALPEPHRSHVGAALRQRGIEAILLVPLRAAAKPIGVFGVNCRVKRRFSPEDERVLQSLADYVAIALENARAHGEVRDALREMERLNHAKSEFVAAVSHEIRSPLSTFVGYVQLLREGAFGSVSTEQAATLGRLGAIAQSTLQLTSDLLDHARADAGALPIRPEAVAVAPLLRELDESVRLLIRGRPLAFDVRIDPGVESVLADPLRLRQILLNLLTNAVKFTERGSITLSAASADAGRRVELAVADTGSGIGADDLPRIFDLFYRAGNQAAISGAGIGLALSQQLAVRMQGTLHVASELGAGTRFTLSLPAAQKIED